MKKIFIASLFTLTTLTLQAQTRDEITNTLLRLDSTFWSAYNTCNIAAMRNFFTDDVEFYHDKGGITNGLDALMNISQKNLCSNPDFRLRREAIKQTIHVFPLYNGNALYGAILSGEHIFYIIDKGKEHLDGHANFTHLWLLKDGLWKMSRILSFEHRPATAKK